MSEGSKRSSVSTISGSIARMEAEPVGEKKEGLGMWMTSFFLIAQMAGAGFLSLPKALSNTGWLGVPMLILFCTMVGFSGTRLGKCWVILEERYPEYKNPCRQPYMEIADRALGVHGRRLTLVSVVITLMGGTIVFLILIASFLNGLIPQLSPCEWLLVVAAVILPFTWLGTPKDFWQASVLAVVSTAVACIVIFIQILVEVEEHEDPFYQNPTISTFALGFGAILFAFGGASVFPTIQNDMADRRQFGKSVVVGFAAILSLYLPVAVAGYAVRSKFETTLREPSLLVGHSCYYPRNHQPLWDLHHLLQPRRTEIKNPLFIHTFSHSNNPSPLSPSFPPLSPSLLPPSLSHPLPPSLSSLHPLLPPPSLHPLLPPFLSPSPAPSLPLSIPCSIPFPPSSPISLHTSIPTF
ncbi:Proton-coupled amino acid transporter 4 [Penaeus vannamei]|uniref:Proton-coupled amino acid transporter 4 n=1 Tax=Penaeus vannamei TaxID=6689 RepID=A0A3R7QYC6_PENVA|nr:Proton-coupled amino acid transporter 4 [Penaeus vannamei]